MLVRPCGVAAFGLDHFEYGVALDRVVRIERDALALFVDCAGAARPDPMTFSETGGLPVYLSTLWSNTCMLPGCPAQRVFVGSKNAAIVADIIEQSVADRRSAGHQSQKPRKRV